jgi:Tfp pilus assembly protein PilF
MSFHSKMSSRKAPLIAATIALTAALLAHAELPAFLQRIPSESTLEAALFRLMDLPGLKVLYPRPPKEAQTELAKLLTNDPKQAELYSLKAMADEQALDFPAADRDWQAFAAHSPDKPHALLELADFYHRRLQPADEARTLLEAAAQPSAPAEAFTSADKQPGWVAFTRVVDVAKSQDLPPAVTKQAFDAWLNRYPKEPAVFTIYANWLIETKQYDSATSLIARYKQAFPADPIFPVKAAALIEVSSGHADQALATYDAAFQPLWPQELIDSQFALIAKEHRQRSYLSGARAALAANPDDLNALARIYWYEQSSSRSDAAQLAINQYRQSKEARKAAWTAAELYTLMSLMQRATAWPEAARYAFALYNLPNNPAIAGSTAQQIGLSAMAEILLTAPDQPIALGARNLSMYSDVATLDQGPGYANGILSLWLNDASPSSELHSEEQKAQPYFHRAKAAHLLDLLDQRFPNAEARAALHAQLISAYAGYGESEAVLQSGKAYLQTFPHAAARVDVAMQMADAYARQQNSTSEFALYDQLLAELAAQTNGMPLTAATAVAPPAITEPAIAREDQASYEDAAPDTTTKTIDTTAFDLTAPPSVLSIPAATQYQQVLERYLSRLIEVHQPQAALAVLRKELDRSPNDPQLYERLAQFLNQNDLSAQQEEIYKIAIARFNDTSWYDKLARLYLREKKQQAFADLTRQVTQTFAGTDLEAYFHNAEGLGPAMSLQLNLYAAKRFPHDLVFTRNLLNAYSTAPTRDDAAYDTLLRAHWFDSDDLRSDFFESLSRTHKLDAELQQLQSIDAQANPAAAKELAEAEMWRSHFEESDAPLTTLTQLYPADTTLGDRAASIFRSLAYFDPAQTANAVAVEQNLLLADPSDLDRLATIGDIYADSGAAGTPGHEDLAAAEPFWHRMATLRPGDANGYLQSATVFWDYFEFDQALDELHAARDHFHNPSLFGYEAGAILEAQRDDAGAIREYIASTLAGDAESRSRLLDLATRDHFAPLITTALNAAGNSTDAMILREDILIAQDRKSELPALLSSELAQANTLDTVSAIADRAHTNELPAVYEQAVQKEIALASDPVQKIQLQYDLVQSLEAHHDTAAATRIVASVYAANPKILGVVRYTVDFYARTGAPAKAIATLREAAAAARPELRRDFTLEAASEATDNHDTALARTLLAPLLAASPFDPQLNTLTAQTYAATNDNAGLRDFYLAKLTAVRTSTLTPTARKQTTLLLRRGLIPALTNLKDYTGATDQYIAMLSDYPEDTGLTDEASLYALRWQQKDRLTAFLQRTVAASPRDARFAAMLAQVDTTYGDLPGAVDSWSHAVAIRADKPDWFASKVDLELRLNRLDAACTDYERLYLLSYRDPQYLVDVARIRAQQGRSQDAVAALERAYTAGHKPAATDQFQIADTLTTWNLLDQARTFAERGIKLGGDAVLIDNATGIDTYITILTRQRHPELALATLTKALASAKLSPNSPTLLSEQVAKNGLASVTDAEWRKRQAAKRAATAATNFEAAMSTMARTVATYDTPEEKSHFAALLSVPVAGNDLRRYAQYAGLQDLYAAYLHDHLTKTPAHEAEQPATYIALQRSRMLFAELGQSLLAYMPTLPRADREPIRIEADDAFHDAGDATSELRVLTSSQTIRSQSPQRDRLFTLLLAHNQPQLVTYAAKADDLGFAAANFAVAHAPEPLALQAVNAAGSAQPPVWHTAYRALTGLFFADFSPATDTAFRTTLADETIAARLDRPLNRDPFLAGEIWFPYAERYAVFRLADPQKAGDPEDFAAAQLEQSSTFDNYVALAHIYADAHQPDAAIVEYRHALELAPDTASLHDAIALLLWSSNHHDQALTEWHTALTLLRAQIDLQVAPPDFFLSLRLIAQHARTHGILPQLKPQLTEVFKAYFAKNGTYRSNELLLVAYDAAASPTEGVDWIIDLTSAAKQQSALLRDIDSAVWLTDADKIIVLKKAIDLTRGAASTADATDTASELTNLDKGLLDLYLSLHRDAEARQILAQLPPEARSTLVQQQVQLAARDNTLPTLLASFDALPDKSFPATSLQDAANTLTAANDLAHSRDILEFLFNRALLRHTLTATDYLALADLRLRSGDTAAALDLLRQLTQQPSSGMPYANNDSAAKLLETSGHAAEAIPFLEPLATYAPWNAEFTLRLAEAQLKANQQTDIAHKTLTTIASSPLASYDLRTRAAIDLRATTSTATNLGSQELNLLASPAITSTQARQPLFAAARLAAATQTKDNAQRESLLREAIAFAPDAPDADNTRIAIFHAESALAHDQLALAAIQPLLETLKQQPSTSTDTTDTAEADQEASDTTTTTPDTDPDITTSETTRAVPSVVATNPARAQLLTEVAAVAWHAHDTTTAVDCLRAALLIAPDDPHKPAWAHTLADYQAVLRREQRNAGRQPIIQTALTQSQTVRPRLLAASSRPVQTPSIKEPK